MIIILMQMDITYTEGRLLAFHQEVLTGKLNKLDQTAHFWTVWIACFLSQLIAM